MIVRRRQVLQLAAGAAALPALPRIVRAQSYPSRPVTLYVSVGAGGAPDIIARLAGQWLTQQLGQGFVIENRPGAGGNIALQAAARAPADGHSLLLVLTPMAVNVTLYEKSPVNVLNDIAPVGSINSDTFVMVTSPAQPYRTVPEFIAHAKANVGKINFASSGTGNLSHLSGELFKLMTGVEMVHVPYKGAVPAIAGLFAGEVHVMFDALPSSLPHVQAGKLRALAVTSATRFASLPDVPAVGETVKGYEVSGWLGIGAPRQTPPTVITTLNRAINAMLADPKFTARLAELGSVPHGGSPADFGRLIRSEVEKWAKVVKFAGLKPA